MRHIWKLGVAGLCLTQAACASLTEFLKTQPASSPQAEFKPDQTPNSAEINAALASFIPPSAALCGAEQNGKPVVAYYDGEGNSVFTAFVKNDQVYYKAWRQASSGLKIISSLKLPLVEAKDKVVLEHDRPLASDINARMVRLGSQMLFQNCPEPY